VPAGAAGIAHKSAAGENGPIVEPVDWGPQRHVWSGKSLSGVPGPSAWKKGLAGAADRAGIGEGRVPRQVDAVAFGALLPDSPVRLSTFIERAAVHWQQHCGGDERGRGARWARWKKCCSLKVPRVVPFDAVTPQE